ncbi:MAG: hypothetical protein IPO41_05540 [Acidobacteria bacterium]|nr:hypothetical protein [Acidobacteriota bacterium]
MLISRDYIAASVAARSCENADEVTRHATSMKSFIGLRSEVSMPLSRSRRRFAINSERVFPPGKVRVISNGVDLAATSEKNERVLGREFRDFTRSPMDCQVVSTLGELRVVKGQRDLVLAANEVINDSQIAIVDWRVSIARSTKLSTRIERLARVLGMEAASSGSTGSRTPCLFWLHRTFLFRPHIQESFWARDTRRDDRRNCPVVATMTGGAVELIPDARP